MVLVQLYFKARPYTIKGLNSILGTRVPFSRRAFGNLFNQTPYFRAMPLLYTLLTGLGRPHRRENDVRKVFTHETGCASRHAGTRVPRHCIVMLCMVLRAYPSRCCCRQALCGQHLLLSGRHSRRFQPNCLVGAPSPHRALAAT